MQIQYSTEQGCALISISGEVDATSALELDRILQWAQQQEQGNVLINCQGLAYISSAGLGVIVSYIKLLQEQSRKLILFGISKPIYNIFSILGLENLLIMADSEQEALALCA